jgi:hypothetical protein
VLENFAAPLLSQTTPGEVHYNVQDKLAIRQGALVTTRGNRESGANPERSRHCKEELNFSMSLGKQPGKTKEGVMIPSQETYLVCAHHDSTRIGAVYELVKEMKACSFGDGGF